MRALMRIASAVVLATGILIAGWGPLIFEALTDRALPAPQVTDAVAMSIWAGMGFFRVLGFGLIVLGATSWALASPTDPVRAAYRALAISGTVAFAGALAQAVAVWLHPLGVLLTVPFALLATLGWRGGWQPTTELARADNADIV